MINNNNLIPTKPIAEERYLNPEIFVKDKLGGLILTEEAKARFRTASEINNDIVVFPVGTEQWEALEVACMSVGCNDTIPGRWSHKTCSYSSPSPIQWSTHARLKCPSCGKILDVSEWSFSCHGKACTNTTTSLTRLTDVVIMALDYEGTNRQFSNLFLKNAREVFKNK